MAAGIRRSPLTAAAPSSPPTPLRLRLSSVLAERVQRDGEEKKRENREYPGAYPSNITCPCVEGPETLFGFFLD